MCHLLILRSKLQQFIHTFLVFCIPMGISCEIQAQNEEIKEIEKIVQYVKKNIQRQEYYLNEFNINANRSDIHQTGYFQHLERYFYTFDKRKKTDHHPILQAIIVTTERDGVSYLNEYVYDIHSNLVYYFEQQKDKSQLPAKKLKIYLSEGSVVKWQEAENGLADLTVMNTKKAHRILTTAQQLQEKFAGHFLAIQVH